MYSVVNVRDQAAVAGSERGYQYLVVHNPLYLEQKGAGVPLVGGGLQALHNICDEEHMVFRLDWSTRLARCFKVWHSRSPYIFDTRITGIRDINSLIMS